MTAVVLNAVSRLLRHERAPRCRFHGGGGRNPMQRRSRRAKVFKQGFLFRMVRPGPNVRQLHAGHTGNDDKGPMLKVTRGHDLGNGKRRPTGQRPQRSQFIGEMLPAEVWKEFDDQVIAHPKDRHRATHRGCQHGLAQSAFGQNPPDARFKQRQVFSADRKRDEILNPRQQHTRILRGSLSLRRHTGCYGTFTGTGKSAPSGLKPGGPAPI